MNALVLLVLLPLVLGTLRVTLTVAGWLAWFISLCVMGVLVCLLAFLAGVPDRLVHFDVCEAREFATPSAAATASV